MDSATTRLPINLQIREPNEKATVTRTFATPEALKIYVFAHKRAVLKALSTPTEAETIIDDPVSLRSKVSSLEVALEPLSEVSEERLKRHR
jgi:hypothetical protein